MPAFTGRRVLFSAALRGVIGLAASTPPLVRLNAEATPRSKIITQIVGDQHNIHVPITAPLAVGIATHFEGRIVPAIVLNQDHHGGLYGTPIKTIKLVPDDYWSSFEIHTGVEYKRPSITFFELRSRLGEVVSGGNPSPAIPANTFKANNIRILGIGGWHGDWFQGLEIEYVENYRPSKVVDESVSAVVDFYVGPQEIDTYQDVVLTKLSFFERVVEQTSEFNTSANANAEIMDKLVKFAASMNTKSVSFERNTTRQSVELILKEGARVKETIASGVVGVRVVGSTLMQDSDDQYWLYPRLLPNWIKLSREEMRTTLVGYFDFTSGISGQLTMHQERLPGGLKRLNA